jgi:UDP-N-acetylglucosamine:LPS N-acetylglucosamine transferase
LKKIKFIIIAGSSAGHILPAIRYINNLSDIKAPNEILFITNEIGKNYLEKIKNDKINKLIVSSKNKFSFMLKIFLNVSTLFLFNRKLILIGFGGFITTPILLISKLFNIIFFSSNKIYIHEQNFIYGLANKINYLIAKNAFISFPKVNMRSKEIFVGNFFLDTNKPREELDGKFVNFIVFNFFYIIFSYFVCYKKYFIWCFYIT